MAGYEHNQIMSATPDAVFDFVADVSNLDRYLPTVRRASPAGPDRVRLEGQAHGQVYDAEGSIHVDRARRRLDWSSDDGGYSGWLRIDPQPSGCNVTVHLEFQTSPRSPDGHGIPAAEVEEGLRKGLESIRNQVEGRGGKEEPDAAG